MLSLSFGRYLGRNVILGDEMGLGKTAQSLSLLHSLHALEQVAGPFLIVVPLSTLPHWERGLALWCPALYVVTYHGSADARRVLLQHDWKLQAPRPPTKPGGRPYRYRFEVVLSTYETVVAEPERSVSGAWSGETGDDRGAGPGRIDGRRRNSERNAQLQATSERAERTAESIAVRPAA